MKYYIFITVIFLSPLFVNAQHPEDQQWLMRDGEWKFGTVGVNDQLNNYVNGSGGQFKIEGVSHPISTNDSSKVPKNRFFGIYNNGDYGFIEITESDNNLYNFGFNDDFAYLYLTNIYEDDDPPPDVKIISTSSGLMQTLVKNGEVTNHDIVDNSDITIILNDDLFNPAVQNYRLCYEIEGVDNSDNKLILNSQSFDGTSLNNVLFNNVLGQSEFVQSSLNPLQKCLTVNHSTSGNVFLNFRAFVQNSIVVDKKVKFYLNGTIISRTTKISGKFHDPNYVQVKCVWENDNNEKFAFYRISCFNDGSSDVTGLEYFLTLPPAVAMPVDIQVTNYQMGCKKWCGIENGNLSIIKNKVNREIQFIFEKGVLQELDSEDEPTRENIAWIEFCVRLLDVDINTVSLQPTSPKTQFSDGTYTEMFPITTYIDEMKCDSLIENQGACGKTVRANIGPCTKCICEKTKIGVWQKIKNLFN